MDELVNRLTTVLKDKLNSIYVVGSLSLGDFIWSSSDFDVFGVTNATLTDRERDHLEQILDQEKFPCPAQGLDLLLMTKSQVENVNPEPDYEFWYATGRNWPREKWDKGQCREMLIFLQLGKEKGIKIYGSEPSVKFGDIDRRLILKAFSEILQWHKENLFDGYHDPGGQNSVLNACRIFMYVEHSRFYSKTEGAEAFLQCHQDHRTVEKALTNRQNGTTLAIEKGEVLALIAFVQKMLDQGLN